MTTNTGECKLCLKARELLKSHVIPELAYKPLYDEHSRAEQLDGTTGIRQVAQKGHRERLLCENCEGIFQRHEHYFSLLWFQHDPLPDPVEGLYVQRAGIEFESFLRFHLSILWRASVARDPMFSAVSLGPFEEPLRQFLLGIVETVEHEPSVHGMILRHPRTHELWNRMVVAPVRSRGDGITTYTFVFAGCSWQYCVSKRGSRFPESLRLKPAGTMIMPALDYTKEASIDRAWKAWKRSSAARSRLSDKG